MVNFIPDQGRRGFKSESDPGEIGRAPMKSALHFIGQSQILVKRGLFSKVSHYAHPLSRHASATLATETR